MRRLSMTTADAFLIVYALDDPNSYEVVKLYMAEIQEIRSDFQEIPIVFAGNKSDLPREQRKVPKELVSNYVYYELPRIRTKVSRLAPACHNPGTLQKRRLSSRNTTEAQHPLTNPPRSRPLRS